MCVCSLIEEIALGGRGKGDAYLMMSFWSLRLVRRLCFAFAWLGLFGLFDLFVCLFGRFTKILFGRECELRDIHDYGSIVGYERL